MDFTTDNRWPVGSLEEKIPATARAVYSARWIDHGSVVDVVPDRQGFAYDDDADRKLLTEYMEAHDIRTLHDGLDFDAVACMVDEAEFKTFMRRSGGYVYVVAWIA